MLSNRKQRFTALIAISAFCLLSTTAIASPGTPFSSGISEFEAYKRQQQQQFRANNDEFATYRQKIQQAFWLYKKKTRAVWGTGNVLPDKTRWVSFLNDINQRSVVDFEQGTVDIEIALPLDNNLSEKQIREQLKDNIETVFRQTADTRSLPDIAIQPALKPESFPEIQEKNTDNPPVLQDQIANEQGDKVNADQLDALAEKLANKAEKKVIRGGDGRLRVVYEAQFRLVPDHIKVRAKKYQHRVNQNAIQQKIRPELVFAVIETESMFNPMARSPAPAFGLMQLVPHSGARDAYQYLYNVDRLVTDTYLYNPDNNIKLGTAYLNRLYYQYFTGIQSDEARLWATIAGYNTGPGNVFRTFAGRYSRARFGNRNNWKRIALREINQRSPEQVYQFMRSTLPYTETRHYIQKVRSRMGKYTAI